MTEADTVQLMELLSMIMLSDVKSATPDPKKPKPEDYFLVSYYTLA
jgi:hypothetical protein